MTRYAEPADLAQVGMSAELTADLDSAVVLGALDKASRQADSYIASAGRYTLPLIQWGGDLRAAVCQIAAYHLMVAAVGYSPEDAANANWRQRYEDAILWLRDVAAGRAVLVDVVDSTADVQESGSVAISSRPLRGWLRG